MRSFLVSISALVGVLVFNFTQSPLLGMGVMILFVAAVIWGGDLLGRKRLPKGVERDRLLATIESAARPSWVCLRCKVVVPETAVEEGRCPQCKGLNDFHEIASDEDVAMIRASLGA